MHYYSRRVHQMAKCWFFMRAQAFISHDEFIYNGPTEEKMLQLRSEMVTRAAFLYYNWSTEVKRSVLMISTEVRLLKIPWKLFRVTKYISDEDEPPLCKVTNIQSGRMNLLFVQQNPYIICSFHIQLGIQNWKIKKRFVTLLFIYESNAKQQILEEVTSKVFPWLNRHVDKRWEGWCCHGYSPFKLFKMEID